MKKLMLLMIVAGLASLSWAKSAREEAVDRLNNSAAVLHEIMGAPDSAIPGEVLAVARLASTQVERVRFPPPALSMP